MLTLLVLLACGTTEAPEPAPEPAPVEEPAAKKPKKAKNKAPKEKVTKAAWVGDWVKDDKILSAGKDAELKLMQDGEVVMSGTLEGKGKKRTAALSGCGADLKLSGVGGDITMKLDGPECPIDFIGTYTNTVSP